MNYIDLDNIEDFSKYRDKKILLGDIFINNIDDELQLPNIEWNPKYKKSKNKIKIKYVGRSRKNK